MPIVPKVMKGKVAIKYFLKRKYLIKRKMEVFIVASKTLIKIIFYAL